MAKIKVGTLFSGIGAFEEALRQLKLPHEIMFACDNGEIELVPLEKDDRKEYGYLDKHAKKLNEDETERYKVLSNKIAGVIEHIRTYALNLESKNELHDYVRRVYSIYGASQENYMKTSYMANYKIHDIDFYTDVRFMSGKFYSDIDIMVGGSPCQSFSTYGKKRGLEDTRGTLFYDYARLIQEIKPKVFIYENVPGLLSHDNKNTWRVMLNVWHSLHYQLFPQILNSVDYNHPQNRRRLFLIGIRDDIYEKNQEYKFPEKMKRTKKAYEYLEKNVDDSYYLAQKGFEWVTDKKKNRNKTRYNREVIGCETANQQFNWIGDLLVERPKKRHYENPNIYIGKIDLGDGKGYDDAVARKMTPRECLNLMGFSEQYKIVSELDEKIVYRQAGNSIVVPVLKELIKTLLPYIE